MRKTVLLSLFGLLSGSALADFTPPEGCTAYMTVQQKSCVVTHYYTCDQDPEGHQWRADLNLDGPYFLSQIDYETQWVLSLDLSQGTRERLALGAPDPASFTELVETGLDSFDFKTITDAGEETQVVGYDRLTGREVIIDGVPLKESANEVTLTDAQTGELKWSAKGKEYISVKHRIFLSGISEWTTADGTSEFDSSPVEFAFPGDRGFLSDTPKYDCNTISASFTVEGASND